MSLNGHWSHIQLFHGITEIILIMFVIDIVLQSVTMHSIQRQLNVLYEFCIDNKRTVNTGKTKVLSDLISGCIAANVI